MRLVKRKCFLSTIYTHCDIWFHLLSYSHEVEQVLVVPLFLVHARIFHIYLPFHCLLKIPTPGQLQPRCQVKLCADHTHFYLREGPFGNVLKKKLRTVVLIVQPINKDETYPNSLTPHAGMDVCLYVSV